MGSLQKLKLILPFLRPYRGRYLAGFFFIAFSIPAVAANPLILKEGIDIIDAGVTFEPIPWLSGAFLALVLLRGFLLFRGRFRVISVARWVERDVRNAIFDRLSRLPAAFYDRRNTGDITSRVINDVEGIRQLAAFGMIIISNVCVMFLFVVAAMFWLDWKLALIAFIPLSLITVLVVVTRRPLHEQALKIQDKLGEISNKAQETFMGIRVVKAFTREKAEVEKFGREVDAYREMNTRYAILRGLTEAGLYFLAMATLFVTLSVGGIAVMEDRMSIGTLMAFTAYQFMLVFPAMAIGRLVLIVQRAAACIDRLRVYLEEPAEEDAEAPEAVLSRDIEVKDLSFQYHDDAQAALDGVSFKIRGGSRVAVVGKVGSGKTTLMNILLRLYPIPDGKVLIGGRDLNTIPPSAVREAIGVVPQDNFLFSDTIRENIRLGSLNGMSDERMLEVSDAARIRDEIEEFPETYNEIIGERGLSLSGGQKQRLSIARALVREPEILILDDAFSSVDAETEQEILKGLQQETQGRTLILITHRLSSVKDMDQIIVMEEGRIVETGRHDELMAARGPYASLYDRFVASRELMDL